MQVQATGTAFIIQRSSFGRGDSYEANTRTASDHPLLSGRTDSLQHTAAAAGRAHQDPDAAASHLAAGGDRHTARRHCRRHLPDHTALGDRRRSGLQGEVRCVSRRRRESASRRSAQLHRCGLYAGGGSGRVLSESSPRAKSRCPASRRTSPTKNAGMRPTTSGTSRCPTPPSPKARPSSSANCVSCHGPDGKGVIPQAATAQQCRVHRLSPAVGVLPIHHGRQGDHAGLARSAQLGRSVGRRRIRADVRV